MVFIYVCIISVTPNVITNANFDTQFQKQFEFQYFVNNHKHIILLQLMLFLSKNEI